MSGLLNQQVNNYLKLKKVVKVIATDSLLLVINPANGTWRGFPIIFKRAIKALQVGILRNKLFYLNEENGEIIGLINKLTKAGLLEGTIARTSIKNVVTDSPKLVIINLGLRCNLSCSYCYAAADHTGNVMKPSILKRTIELINNSNIPKLHLSFTGGEPLLQFNFLKKFVSKLKRTDIRFSLQTNGTQFTQHRIDWLKKHNFEIGISLDGPAEIQNQRRIFTNGMGTLDYVLESLALLQKSGLEYTTVSVIEKAEDYMRLWDFAVENDLERLSCNLYENLGRGKKDFDYQGLRKRAEKHLEFFDKSLEYFLQTGKLIIERNLLVFINNLISQERPFMCQRSPCGAGNSMIYINYDGWIYPCSRFCLYPTTRISHVNNIVSIQNFGRERTLVTELKQRTINKLAECNDCAFRAFCGGGCCGTAFNVNGQIQAKSPYCQYYKLVFFGLMERLTLRKEEIRRYYQQAIQSKL